MRETSPRDIAREFGARPDITSQKIALKLGVPPGGELSFLRDAVSYSKEVCEGSEMVGMGIVHVMDRVINGLEQQGIERVMLDHFRVKNFKGILYEFLDETVSCHERYGVDVAQKRTTSVKDAIIVMKADGLTGEYFSGQEMARSEGVGAHKKLSLLEESRQNFTSAMIDWMLAR